jgi:CDGSH-type Zn-finger protein
MEPLIAARKPAVLDLEPGTYTWCACGRSKNQPWCDGSHKGTGFTPIRTQIDEKKRVAMCVCKHSANKPYCDGTHKRLPESPPPEGGMG